MEVSGTFCDRCGKQIKEPDNRFHAFQSITTYMLDTGITHKWKYDIDLCPECMDEFEKWIKSGNADKKNSEGKGLYLQVKMKAWKRIWE